MKKNILRRLKGDRKWRSSKFVKNENDLNMRQLFWRKFHNSPAKRLWVERSILFSHLEQGEHQTKHRRKVDLLQGRPPLIFLSASPFLTIESSAVLRLSSEFMKTVLFLSKLASNADFLLFCPVLLLTPYERYFNRSLNGSVLLGFL